MTSHSKTIIFFKKKTKKQNPTKKQTNKQNTDTEN